MKPWTLPLTALVGAGMVVVVIEPPSEVFAAQTESDESATTDLQRLLLALGFGVAGAVGFAFAFSPKLQVGRWTTVSNVALAIAWWPTILAATMLVSIASIVAASVIAITASLALFAGFFPPFWWRTTLRAILGIRVS